MALLGIAFDVIAPTCEEILSPNLSPSDQAKQFAQDKAQSVADDHPQHVVVGSDTVIEIDGKLLGKPNDLAEAESMLRLLQGQCHQVHTGLALVQQSTHHYVALVETAHVWIKSFEEKELTRYLDTKESLGKAGAYSIQGEGAKLIEKFEGDYLTIVGLPLWRTAKLLEKQGVVCPNSVEEIYRLRPYANWKDFI